MSDATAASAPPANEVRSPLSDGEWHRMHPLTPLLRGGLFIIVVAGIIIANLRERLLYWFVPSFAPGGSDTPTDPIEYLVREDLLVVAILLVLATLVVLIVLFTLSWRFHTFRITDDDVEVRSGILFRTHRRAPLDRVQGVNLTRPLVARLVGLAKLEVVGAGTDANVKLEYLATSHAETIRSDILRLASGRRLGAGRTAGAAPGGTRIQHAATVVGAGITGIFEGEDQAEVEPASVVHIPPGRLIGSRLLSGTTLVLLVLIAAIIVGAVVGTPWVLFSVIPAFLGFGAYYVRSITRALRYSIAPMPSGTRITFGLFTTVSETVPPGRVHAVEVKQSILWRPFGWWSITVNRLSGRSATDTTTDQFTTVLPVGTRADVERVLRLLLPALPEADWPFVFDQGILGPGADDPYATTPRRARWFRPLSWRRNGFLLTRDALFFRRGYIWRALGVFPLARMQSVGLAQGPVDRALGVANLTAHVVAGSVTTVVGVVDRDDAVRGFEDAAIGIVAASAGDHSHRWASAEVEPIPVAVPAEPAVARPVDASAPDEGGRP